MNKKYLILVVAIVIILGCQINNNSSFFKNQIIVSTDISNFWEAYDAIIDSQDTIKQMDNLKSMFLNGASEGQKRMIEACRYTPEEYLKNITTHSQFWNSIRKNTENLEPFNEELRKEVGEFIFQSNQFLFLF